MGRRGRRRAARAPLPAAPVDAAARALAGLLQRHSGGRRTAPCCIGSASGLLLPHLPLHGAAQLAPRRVPPAPPSRPGHAPSLLTSTVLPPAWLRHVTPAGVTRSRPACCGCGGSGGGVERTQHGAAGRVGARAVHGPRGRPDRAPVAIGWSAVRMHQHCSTRAPQRPQAGHSRHPLPPIQATHRAPTAAKRDVSKLMLLHRLRHPSLAGPPRWASSDHKNGAC
jgi:hypothetical protein